MATDSCYYCYWSSVKSVLKKGLLLGLVLWCWFNLVVQVTYEVRQADFDDSPASVNWEYINWNK